MSNIQIDILMCGEYQVHYVRFFMAVTNHWRSRILEQQHGAAYSQVTWHEDDAAVAQTAFSLGMTAARYKNAQASIMTEFNDYLRQNRIVIHEGQIDSIYAQFSDWRNEQRRVQQQNNNNRGLSK